MARADITRIAKLVGAARAGVGFTGAGISTDSGIPDYRSPHGVWSKYQPVYFDEFVSSPAARYRYWMQKCEGHSEISTAEPNSGHRMLVNWEKAGYLRGVVTQNIDGLHELAGNEHIMELHGNARKVGCLNCDFLAPADDFVAEFLERDQVPNCPRCGGLLKHATVSFGQALPESVLQTAVQWSRSADLFLALGSSLVVTPAADLPRLAREHGAALVIINREATPLDSLADVVINESISDTLTAIAEALQQLTD